MAIMRTVVLWLVVSLAACTQSQQTSSEKYWWLGLKKSPFGGRNYNSDEIQRGEHIPQGTKFNRKGGRGDKAAQRTVKQITKRQAEVEGESEEVFSEEAEEEENEIQLNEIDTQCPRRTSCIERFFCEKFSGKNVFDQIPCLLTSGEFAGDFGICCESAYAQVCPRVPVLPDPKDCLRRPLGDPEDTECQRIGSRSSCAAGSLCCFNGCINVCLEDPPYSVQSAFFFRQKAIIIGGNPKNSPKPNKPVKGGGSEFSSAEKDPKEESLSGESVLERDFNPEKTKQKSPKLKDSSRVSRVLLRLIERLRERIS
eukprot:GFUD01009927.1.p1 GENE.GFUD01009927.1~~GFUD01009927.1.p1  ORF type:complete len:311 (+),score=50.39 GFUD01009927.1:162-1094(+)